MNWRRRVIRGVIVFSLIALPVSLYLYSIRPQEIVASVETEPVPSPGDAADDPAIWRHPAAPALSTVIGTDKRKGLAVYDLQGRQLQFVPDGRINNVDLRDGFVLAGRRVTLVTASNESESSIAIYMVNEQTRRLEAVAARRVTTTKPYGACMYRSPVSGKYYYFVNSKKGTVEQWELYESGSGKVDATKVRWFDVGSQPEGCVADDELGFLYLGVEEEGIRKYGAEPADGSEHTVVDTTGWRGNLHSDVEGLTIYYGENQAGYLIASSQGKSEFVIYQRGGNNDYVGTFKIVAGNGIDAVSGTDGIDVTSRPLGSPFHAGLFVAQDDRNDKGHQNFKFVSWEAIARTLADTAP